MSEIARLHSALWRDAEIDRLFAPEFEISAMLRFEAALAQSQASCGVISNDAAAAITTHSTGFAPDMERLLVGIGRDGMAVPELMRQLRAGLAPQHRDALHLRSTSQDVIDTVLVLQISEALTIICGRIARIMQVLDELDAKFGDVQQMGRTRMQRALPLHARDRIAAWRAPLIRLGERLHDLRPRLLVVQCGGPVGIDVGPWLPDLAAALGLGLPQRSWHTARDTLGEFASWLSLVTGCLGKIGTDVAMMAQNESGEAAIAGGGTSSAMHHKSNPVRAELLVALARYNAGQLGGFHQALVHEQERSGAAWALEWMILPEMFSVCASALAHALALLQALTLRDRSPL
jgi:3-carboxy-cis,cis-muconate cycloisomerase